MTGRNPDFEELVGSELEPSERERLRRIHDLLVEVGPPPELSSDAARAGHRTVVSSFRLARRVRVVALAAALGVVVFALGFVSGDRSNEYGTFRTVAMSGTARAEGASARIEIFDADDAGNWPMELDVRDLRPTVSGRLYELWLTHDGQPAALCGSFLADSDGTTVVPINAPWRLDEFDGWVVVEEGTKAPLLIDVSS